MTNDESDRFARDDAMLEDDRDQDPPGDELDADDFDEFDDEDDEDVEEYLATPVAEGATVVRHTSDADADDLLPREMTEDEIREIELLVSILPERVATPVRARGFDGLIEIIMDLGRRPTARYRGEEFDLTEEEVKDTELAQVVAQVSEFGDDNRAGIPRTLHRISAIRNRRGHIVGLTCRVGRSVSGSGQVMRDLIEAGHSILLLGPPGVGKTTMLRDVARMCADELSKRVVIVDTSNEIGGDGDIPHKGIGRSRRMQVSRSMMQHEVMIEAVENHTPEVIVIDEIGTGQEAEAARTIAERGVQLIGTAHGTSLSNLMQNPTLSDLIGGIESVTLSDEEARRRGTQKTVLERRAPPTFDVLVEIQSFRRLSIHEDVAATVDSLLRGYEVEAEIRVAGAGGQVESVERVPLRSPREEPLEPRVESSRARNLPAAPVGPEKRLLPFGISRGRLQQVIEETRSAARIVDSVREADAVLTLRPHYRRRAGPLKQAEERGIPIYVLRSNSPEQIERQLLAFRGEDGREDPTTKALREAEDAVAEITFRGASQVELSAASPYIRRLQHELVARHGLRSLSKGREPFRRVAVIQENIAPTRGIPWASDTAADR
jgi:stage III sporulation protein AA